MSLLEIMIMLPFVYAAYLGFNFRNRVPSLHYQALAASVPVSILLAMAFGGNPFGASWGVIAALFFSFFLIPAAFVVLFVVGWLAQKLDTSK